MSGYLVGLWAIRCYNLVYGESKNKYVVDNQIIVVVYASIQRICVGLFVHGTLRIYVHA